MMFCPFVSSCHDNCAFFDKETRQCKLAMLAEHLEKLNNTLKSFVKPMNERMKRCKAAAEGSAEETSQKKTRRKKPEVKE